MDIIFMNFGNSKTSDPHRLLLNPSDKVNLTRSDKYVALSNLSIYMENHKKTTHLKYHLQHGMKNWNRLPFLTTQKLKLVE